MAERASLRIVLGDYPHTRALKAGMSDGPSVRLAFQPVEPVHKAFAPMVRRQAYDLCELAVVTALQAIAHGAPIVLLPAVVASRFQRGCLIADAGRPALDPASLAGRRIAVRAYTQTTGFWVRAHLEEDTGLDVRQVDWLTRDAAHVQAYRDPAWVRTGPDKALTAMLRDGDADAAILGNDLPDGPDFVPVIPDAAARDRAWWQTHRFMPINHMVVASQAAVARDPDAVRAAYRLMRDAAGAVAPPQGEPSRTLFGLSALRAPIGMIIGLCVRQGLLPRALSLHEVLGEAATLLGPDGD